MDPVTHAASGAVAMLSLSRRPVTLWAAPLAAIVCAAPDIDLVFIYSPFDFLLLHRGITHSFAAAPVFGFILALCCWPLWRKSVADHWRFRVVWLFCCLMILLHIWLDVVTTYGTMVFLPFSHYRVRLNSIFMIDLLVTVPLLWAVCRWYAKPKLALLTLLWIFIYPACGIAINHWHAAQWRDNFAAENRHVERLHVLPDAFAPFFWRVLYEEHTDSGLIVGDQSINALGQARGEPFIKPAAPPHLVERLMRVSGEGRAYFEFAMLPVMEDLPLHEAPAAYQPGDPLKLFYDLRFGSGLEFVRKIMAMRPNADLPFQFMLYLSPGKARDMHDYAAMDIREIRLKFSDSGRDSLWHQPVPPARPDLLQWLVGLE